MPEEAIHPEFNGMSSAQRRSRCEAPHRDLEPSSLVYVFLHLTSDKRWFVCYLLRKFKSLSEHWRRIFWLHHPMNWAFHTSFRLSEQRKRKKSRDTNWQAQFIPRAVLPTDLEISHKWNVTRPGAQDRLFLPASYRSIYSQTITTHWDGLLFVTTEAADFRGQLRNTDLRGGTQWKCWS